MKGLVTPMLAEEKLLTAPANALWWWGGARVVAWRGFGGRRWSARVGGGGGSGVGGTSGRGADAGGGRGARVRTMLRTALGWVKLQV